MFFVITVIYILKKERVDIYNIYISSKERKGRKCLMWPRTVTSQ